MSDSNWALEDDTALILEFITYWATKGKPNTRPTHADVQKFMLARRKKY